MSPPKPAAGAVDTELRALVDALETRLASVEARPVGGGGSSGGPRMVTDETALSPGELGTLDDGVSAPQYAYRRTDGKVWYSAAFSLGRTTAAGGNVLVDQNLVTYPEGAWSTQGDNVWAATLQQRMLSITALDAVFGGSYHAPFRPNAVGAALAVGEVTASIAPTGVVTLYIKTGGGSPSFRREPQLPHGVPDRPPAVS